MSSYLIFAAAVVILLVVIGIPAITRLVKIPCALRWQELAEADLSPAAAELFKETDAAALALHFHPVKNFTVPGLAQTNQNRLYFNPEAATVLVATVLAQGGKNSRVLEFNTEFQDGVAAATSNAQVTGLFAKPDWHQVRQFPGLLDLARLQAAHQQRVQERLSQGIGPRQLNEDQLLDQMIQSQIRQMEYQVEKGLLRLDEAQGMYRATYRIALRGIANFLNPLADNFTFRRFALGFGLGVALAAAAVLLAKPLGLEQALRQLFPSSSTSQIKFLLYCPGFVLAGLAMGWQFREKGFLWGFLVSLPALILLPAGVTQPIFYSIVAAQAGQAANRLAESGQSGGGQPRLSTALLILAVLIGAGFYYVS